MGNWRSVGHRPRYVQEKASGFYYRATAAMREAGLRSEALGTDRGAAYDRADALNDAWDAIRRGNPVVVEAPAAHGTLERFVQDLRRSAEYRDKSKATQDELEYALKTILATFGPTKLKAIQPSHVEIFYGALRAHGSVHRAHRHMKWLRYLLNRAIRLGQLDRNPAMAVRVTRPPPRDTVWKPNQVEQAIAAAHREGQHAIGLALAVAYDTGLRPVDIRNLTHAQIEPDRLALIQAKTGKVTHLPLLRETRQAIDDYVAAMALAPLPNAVLLRTRRGRPYTKDYLAKGIRRVLRAAGVPDAVRLSDLRRTASKERAEAGATEAEIAAAGGWSIERGSQILDVYNPRTLELARNAQDKRRRNKSGRKV